MENLIKSSLVVVILLVFGDNSYGQIYESIAIEDQRNVQYDTLDIQIVKEYGFGWKWKLRQLQSIKKYDSDGYLIEVTIYDKQGKKRRKPVVTKVYEYNSDRTEIIEIWLDRSKRKADTSFIITQVYDVKGILLSETEELVKENEVRKKEYSYDHFGNCQSISHSSRFSNYTIYFQNEYDSSDMIVRQIKKLRLGGKSEHSRIYNDIGNVIRDSIGNGSRVEVFKYNQKGEIERKDYYLDSTALNNDIFSLKKCVLGSEYYEYDCKGRLRLTNYTCEAYINMAETGSVLILERRFEYNELGLLTRTQEVFNHGMLGRRPNKAHGRIFKYN